MSDPEQKPPKPEGSGESIGDQPAGGIGEGAENIQAMLSALKEGPEAARLEAISGLKKEGSGQEGILQALENLALRDESQSIRTAALQALASPVFQPVQFRRARLTPASRQALRAEISRWENDGLIDPELAGLLRSRYPLTAQAPVQPADSPPEKAAERPSLAQVLLSEASVQVALYLGALFTLAAAAIFASAFEGLRLVILGGTTLAFFGAAGLLYFRLRQASFIMYLIATLLLLVDGGVVIDSFSFSTRQVYLFWSVLLAFSGALWLLGGLIFRSRLFSLFWFWNWTVSAIFLAIWWDAGIVAALFIVSLATLIGLPGALFLRRFEEKIGKLTYIFAALQMVLVFAASLLGFLLLTALDETLQWSDWLLLAGTGLAATLFWTLSDIFITHPVFRFMAIAALLPVPLWLMGAAQPTIRWAGIGIAAWGLILAVWGELVRRIKLPAARVFAPYLLYGAFPILLLAGLVGLGDTPWAGLAYFVLASIVFAFSYQLQQATASWTASLFFSLLAYYSLFNFNAVRRLDIFQGFIHALPAIGLLVWARPGISAHSDENRRRILLGGGGLLGGLSVLLGLAAPAWQEGAAAVLFTIWGLFFLGYERFSAIHWLAYFAIAGFSLAFVYALLWLDVRFWLLAEALWSAGLYFSGLLLQRRASASATPSASQPDEIPLEPTHSIWGRALAFSGLVIALLVALAAPLQDEGSAVLGVAILAGLFALEAFRRRNIWLGFPANLLLLEAWFLGLVFLDIRQPQYYSIAAAMLGIVMHYLLVRGSGGTEASPGSKLAAFITGLLAVMTLLSTTYVQLVSSGSFTWFFLLFPQALAVLAYGLVVRSRSFVIVPLGFIILAVLTAVFLLAEGIYVLPLLACCGFLLLGLGIAALLTRERLLAATEAFRNRPGGWRA